MQRFALLAGLALCPPAWAQTGTAPGTEQGAVKGTAPDAPPGAEQAASRDAAGKLNTYVALLNRTLRASESLNRYASWANMRTGPTGRESIVYGLYGLYDVRGEIERARAAAGAPPPMPELDAEVERYIAAYEALAPIIGQAEGYYERGDYRLDKMAEGKALHARLAPAAQAYLAERARLEPLLAREKDRSDRAELALLEQREGRKARWQVRNVMVQARPVLDLLPTEAKPVVDMVKFDAVLAAYAAAVRELDAYAAAEPGTLSGFESQPRSWLGTLREFRDKLAQARGDARRGAGRDLTWIVSGYNTMVSMADVATRSR